MSAQHENDLAAAKAKALFERAQRLGGKARHAEALAWYAAVVEQFGKPLSDTLRRELDVAVVRGGAASAKDEIPVMEYQAGTVDPETGQFVAWALTCIGIMLERLDRPEAALLAYDEVCAGFAGTQHALTLVRVAWAMCNKGLLLSRLDRVQAAIEAFDAVIERFGASDDVGLRLPVAQALAQKAFALGLLGEQEQAIAVGDEMLDRYGDADEISIRDVLVDGLSRRAAALEKVRGATDAIEAFDEALLRLAHAPEAALIRRKVECLLGKAMVLDRADRDPEAIVVFGGVVSAYRELQVEDRDARSLGFVVLAMMMKVLSVCSVDPARSAVIVEELQELLTDVTWPPSGRPAPRRELAEPELAALLQELYNGDCWIEFATGGEDRGSQMAMEAKALALYRQTAGPFACTAADTPAYGGISLIRYIADGYALLARDWCRFGRPGIALPSSLLLDHVARSAGIADWAAGHGHPLQLSDFDDLAEDLFQAGHEETDSWDPDLGAVFVASVRHLDMLALLSDSPSGRAALHLPHLKGFACWRLNDARNLASWASMHEEDGTGVAVACVIIAQACFVATHDTVSSSEDLFPSRETLAKTLRQHNAYRWLDDHDIELPAWLEPDGG